MKEKPELSLFGIWALYLLENGSSPRTSYCFSIASCLLGIAWAWATIHSNDRFLWGFSVAWFLVSLLFLQKAAYSEVFRKGLTPKSSTLESQENKVSGPNI